MCVAFFLLLRFTRSQTVIYFVIQVLRVQYKKYIDVLPTDINYQMIDLLALILITTRMKISINIIGVFVFFFFFFVLFFSMVQIAEPTLNPPRDIKNISMLQGNVMHKILKRPRLP